MAIYKTDIVDIELNSGSIHRSFMNRTIGEGDDMANRFGVRVLREGRPENLNNVECSGYFIRPDGSTIVIDNGVVDSVDSIAYVTLPEACYVYEGSFCLAIKLTGGSVTGTVRIVDGVVSNTSTTTYVDPGTIIPSIEYLIAAIDAAVASIPEDYSELNAVVKSQSGILSLSDAVSVPFIIDDTGSITAADGTVSASSTFSHTDFIDVSAYAYISYKQIGITSSSITAGVAWYDASRTYIAGIKGIVSQAEAGYVDGVALVPYGARYARFTTFTDTSTRGYFSAAGYSKTVADANANLEAFSHTQIPPTMLAQGSITGTSGNNDSSTDTNHGKRVRTPRRVHKSVRRVVMDSGYSVAAYAYNKTNGTYIGRIVTSGKITTASDSINSIGWMPEIDLWTLSAIYPNYCWRLVFRKNNDAEQSPEDIAPHVTYIIDREEASGAIFPTQRIPADTACVYTLYDAFVTAGLATRTTLATVQSLPIYKYDFKALDGWMDGSDYHIDTSGDRLFPKFQILFTSGMHGDEKSAVTGLYEFMNLVCNNPDYVRFLALCDIHVIPVCNPTGYNADTRNNYQDININRIDEAGDTVECQAIQGVIDSQTYDLYVDLHNMRTDTASADIPGPTGGMSFANDTPEAFMTKEYRTYMEATTHTTQVMMDELSKTTNNGRQAFYPWRGQDVESFRQYGYTHQHDGVTVGSPISGTMEVSRRCYSMTENNVDYNGYAIMICDQCVIDTLGKFIDKVTSGYFG